MRCELLASFLLLFSISSKGAVSADSGIIWGTLGHDINLTIPVIQVTEVDEVRWVKGGNLVAQFKRGTKPFSKSEAFKILADGSLHIKQLKRDDNGTYDVEVYDVDGKSKLQKAFRLSILERVSKPAITWECSNTTLTCEVKEGTGLELKLYRGKRLLASGHQKIIGHKWTTLSGPFKCNAKNKVSEESVTAVVSCSGVTWLRAGKEPPLEGSIVGSRRETLAGGNPTCSRERSAFLSHRGGWRRRPPLGDPRSTVCFLYLQEEKAEQEEKRRRAGDKSPPNEHRGKRPEAVLNPSRSISESRSFPSSSSTWPSSPDTWPSSLASKPPYP
ncbi:T-cell surface antigen CD2 isoform X2 [Peromyscus leucopus]|uniref:T-cell surface antigen CD2 isoform X2 n=1 Tax=Peromyscus leucopus TaxID=10041 RepID=UPI001884B7EA|nr:T-cell surface antigen CD2 isoform X2 [Peromyscus leucopus]